MNETSKEEGKIIEHEQKKKKEAAEKKKEAEDKEALEKKKKEDQDNNSVWCKKKKKLHGRKGSVFANTACLKADAEVDSSNPKYMYASLGEPWSDRYLEHDDPPLLKYWNELDDDLEDDFVPDEDHVFLQEEIDALAEMSSDADRKEKPWPLIVQAAMSMRNNIDLLNLRESDEYTDQQYIDIACLVDPGRELKFDRQQVRVFNKIEIQVNSYELKGRLIAGSGKRKMAVIKDQRVVVFRNWLKDYLGYYDPGYYEFIENGVFGAKVQVLDSGLASAHETDYTQSGIVRRYRGVVPLPKGHLPIFLDQAFVKDFAAPSTKSDRTKQRQYTNEFEKVCNPSIRYDKVPFPQCMAERDKKQTTDDPESNLKVPLIHVQITGIKAEIKRNPGVLKSKKKLVKADLSMRWLGVQNSRYVALPPVWVDKNIEPDVRAEAYRRGRARLLGEPDGQEEQFVRLPPGDCRTDDPPVSIRSKSQGINYYYQEMVDNCLLGGFVNAIFQMYGEVAADTLLSKWSPLKHNNLNRRKAFIDHVQETLGPMLAGERVWMSRLKETYTLQTNDDMPIVLLLTGRDGSATHSITCYQGHIYDSASRYVLKKSATTLNWCCGKYGYEKTHLAYVFHSKTHSYTKKRKRVRR
jgi:hypothetical protein